jgi:hypothetical protein
MDLFVTKLGNQEDPVQFKFRRGYNPPASGLKQLAQKFAFMVLKDPDEDSTSTGIGGGIRNKVRNASDQETARSACAEAIVLAENQIKQSQEGMSGLQLTERLKSARLKHIEMVDSLAGKSVYLQIEITSENNQSTAINVTAGQ